MTLNGSVSEPTHIKSGIIQGSILDPILFLVYINGLEKNIESNNKFFGDDTMLFPIVTKTDYQLLLI